MALKVPDEFEEQARMFFASCSIDPTDYQLDSFVRSCLAVGLDAFAGCNNLMIAIAENPTEPVVHAELPPGLKCPDCKFPIVLRQDLKRTCNCRCW